MKEEIYLIITKYLSSRANQEEVELLLAWIEESEHNRNTFDQLKRIWEHRVPEENPADARQMLDMINARIEIKENKSKKAANVRHRRLIPSIFLKAAAALVILTACLGLGTWTYRSFLKPALISYLEIPTKEIRTVPGEKKKVLLPDGSIVHLNSNSSIRYLKKFSPAIREVYIEGEAFLDVKHYNDWPFIVHSQTVSTKVLGTKFNIYSQPDQNQLKVSLVEGKVEIVNEKEPGSAIVLLPEEEIIIDTKTKVVIKQHFEKENAIAWTNNTLIFDNEPMSEVAQKLSAWYGVKVVFQNTMLLDCRFRGKFHEASLENILQTMKKTGVITYEISDDNIVFLNGEGCMEKTR